MSDKVFCKDCKWYSEKLKYDFSVCREIVTKNKKVINYITGDISYEPIKYLVSLEANSKGKCKFFESKEIKTTKGENIFGWLSLADHDKRGGLSL